jgi:hypothetical protein
LATPQPLAEQWNGSAWTIQSTPNPTGSNQNELYAVSCASSTTCTAVGAGIFGTLAEQSS